jgi:hypothetical protein
MIKEPDPAGVAWNPPNAAMPAQNEQTQSVAPDVDCEEKPYIQYKDELHVFGDKATVAQMCQIKAGTTLACDRELTKITLVLRAADISVEDNCK